MNDLEKLKEKLPPFVYVDDLKTGGVRRFSFGVPEVVSFTKAEVLEKAGGVKACANAEWLNDIAGLYRGDVAAMTAGFTKGWNRPEANPANYERGTGKYNAPMRTAMLAQRRALGKNGLER